MSPRTRLIAYPEERALEDAAYAQGMAPTRIFALLLPVLRVEVKADVTDAEPYELIDRYLERGIAEAGLDTAADLAGFLGLDETLVDRALRFLTATGHLSHSGNRLSLTPLGQQSVRDQVRYVVTRQDRRKMYFDAFGSRPLTRPYYDVRTVTMLSAAEVDAAAARGEGPRYLKLGSTRGFRREALTELARNPERDRYNLPERIDRPESLGEEETVYLPMYVVRAVQRDGRVRYLAYTQVSDQADKDITALCERTAEIVSVLDTEERAAGSSLDETRARDWLRRRNLEGAPPVRLADGTWRVSCPAASFAPGGPLPLTKLGSFVVLGNDFFQVWCREKSVRQRALLERVGSYLSARMRIDRTDLDQRIAQIARQLDLGAVDISALRQMAVRADKRNLATQLDRIT